MPLISITIPTYKNVPLLKRLLDSIATQTFGDYEVIITDDTPDESVQELVHAYSQIKNLKYFKNNMPLGTPENWNEGIRKASGDWIKIMHHDDWFSRNDALELLSNQTQQNVDCIFFAYKNVYQNNQEQTEEVIASAKEVENLLKTPWLLFASNKIGPPSVTMIRQSILEVYDNQLKWRVDTEFYIRLIQKKYKFQYLSTSLINVGIHESQVTQYTFLNPKVELEEGLYLLQKHSVNPLKNIWVYDAWWRLFRNLNIRSMEEIQNYAAGTWPTIMHQLVADISLIPIPFLKIGFVSKCCMAVSYFRRRHLLYA